MKNVSINISSSSSGQGLREDLQKLASSRGRTVSSLVGDIFEYAVENQEKFAGPLLSPRKMPGKHISAKVEESIKEKLTQWSEKIGKPRMFLCSFILQKTLESGLIEEIFDLGEVVKPLPPEYDPYLPAEILMELLAVNSITEVMKKLSRMADLSEKTVLRLINPTSKVKPSKKTIEQISLAIKTYVGKRYTDDTAILIKRLGDSFGTQSDVFFKTWNIDELRLESEREQDILNEKTKPRELQLLIDHGSAPKELVAKLLADLSILYRLEGGSGITFEFMNAYMPQFEIDYGG